MTAITLPATEFRRDDAPDRADFAEKFCTIWRSTTESIIAAGRILLEAKSVLAHRTFTAMIEADLPVAPRTAQDLMQIAKHPVLANPKHASLLPPAWSTLAQLAKIDEERLEKAIEAGQITPTMKRSDVDLLKPPAPNKRGGRKAAISPRTLLIDAVDSIAAQLKIKADSLGLDELQRTPGAAEAIATWKAAIEAANETLIEFAETVPDEKIPWPPKPAEASCEPS